MRSDFETIDVDRVKLEELRYVVAAMAKELGWRLERKEPFYGEPEFRFVPND